jgi:bifunctional ADP-heptose synthase (sugar kinase/adenylyltransferase)
MKSVNIELILESLKKVKVAVLGDFCIDAYWILNPDGGEISVETGQKTNAVRKHYYTLGGASNIVANLAALNPEKIYAIGCIGEDIFGRELLRQLKQLNVNCDGIIIQPDNYDTVAFGKPVLEENELPRIDFGFFNKKSETNLKAL